MRGVVVKSGDRVICVAQVADNPWTRGRGLLGRARLSESEGLWIMPCKSIHTFFMRFPIDAVYLAKDGTVVKTAGPLRPARFSAGGRKANSVLELPAGFLQREKIAVGERLSMEPHSTRPPW